MPIKCWGCGFAGRPSLRHEEQPYQNAVNRRALSHERTTRYNVKHFCLITWLGAFTLQCKVIRRAKLRLPRMTLQIFYKIYRSECERLGRLVACISRVERWDQRLVFASRRLEAPLDAFYQTPSTPPCCLARDLLSLSSLKRNWKHKRIST